MSDELRCPHSQGCELYSKFAMKGSLKIWQLRYCNHKERHKTCSRYELAEKGQPVPATLLPNGAELIVE